ncbi:MAG: serine protease [Deltaproteobacteria bacterium]|nr:MAG: serine protease [Deltaproteobacteria bacterium]
MLDQNRLCLLRVPFQDSYRVGTGYAITNTLVLTAQHILPPLPSSNTPVQVELMFPNQSEEWHSASPVWTSDEELDACLLELSTSLAGVPPSLGRYDRSSTLRWQSAGFPQAAAVQKGSIDYRDTAGLSGALTPEGSMRRGYYELTVEAAPEMQDWPGLSGSPVFAEGRLLGFVRSVPSGFKGKRLHAVAIENLLEEEALLALLGSPTLGRVPRGLLRLPVPASQHSPRSPSALLLAQHRTIPFVPELHGHVWSTLQTWCKNPSPPNAVQLVVGPGGSGKTRLLLELCLWSEESEGWSAGFLPESLNDEQWDQLHTSGRPTLVVIDYAETRPHLSQDLIRLLERSSLPRLRVVLLARDTGDWWDALPQQLEHVRHTVDEAEQGSLTHRLRPISLDDSQRRKLLLQAYQSFAGTETSPPVLLPSLHDPQFGCILYLHAAALTLQEGKPLTTNNVLEQVLDREEKYWKQTVQKEWPNDRARRRFAQEARRWFAAITLRGGVRNEDEASALHQSIQGPSDWVELSEELYPGNDAQTWLRGLEPDPLGEALVYRTLTQHKQPISYLQSVMEDAPEASIQFGFTVLGRVAMQHPQDGGRWLKELLTLNLPRFALPAFDAALALGRQTAFAPLGQYLAEALAQSGDLSLAEQLAPRLRRRSISLQEVTLWVTETQLQHLAQSTSREPYHYIQLLSECGRQRSQMGDNNKALDLLQEAVMLSRQFPQDLEHKAMLARHLRSLSGVHGRLNQHEQALHVIQEATTLHRTLFEEQPEQYIRELATSLHSLSVQHSFNEQAEEALNAVTEAVQLRRSLFEQQPQRYRGALASSLSQQGIQLDKLGQHALALEAEMEAVVHRKALADLLPDAYLPDYAQSLTSLSIRYSRSKLREEALTAAQQAVVIIQDCAEAQPEAFVGRLLAYSKNLQRRLWECKQEPGQDEVLYAAVVTLRNTIEAGHLDGRRLGTLRKIGLEESEEGQTEKD